MAKKTIRDLDIKAKRVLARVDFNVPQDDDGRITDDRRIVSALPTVRHVLTGGGRLILMSHLGRPEGKDRETDKAYTLAPVAERLSELLGQAVPIASDCIGPDVASQVAGLKDGQCCMLENLRFHAAEQIKDKDKDAKKDPKLRETKDAFGRQIAALGDIYVNDAFGTCHRDNASMLTVPQMMAGKPRVIGFLVEKELKFLGEAVANPKRPFAVILGGAKVSDKIGVIESLRTKCDQILIGGAMIFTFWGAAGLKVGKSLREPDKYDLARNLRSRAPEFIPGGSRGGAAVLHVPIDAVCAAEMKSGIPTQVGENGVPEGLMGLDIGPKSLESFKFIISRANTIVWNGPMGAFETPPFDRGTLAIAQELAKATKRGAVTIIGGGDSAAAVEAAGLADQMTHVSTGGGASLEFLEGKQFAALEVLDDA